MLAGAAALCVSWVLSTGAARASVAVRNGQICPTFTQSKLTFEWEAIGSFTCKSAMTWVEKLAADHVSPLGGEIALTNGPKGYHCYATLEKKGVASSGLCYKGTAAYPTSGFNWTGA
jgi:hypothetical protein